MIKMRETNGLTLEDFNERLGKAMGHTLMVCVVGNVTMAQCYENFKWSTNEDKNGNGYYSFYDEDLEVPMIFVDMESITGIEDGSLSDEEIHIVVWMDGEVCVEIDEG